MWLSFSIKLAYSVHLTYMCGVNIIFTETKLNLDVWTSIWSMLYTYISLVEWMKTNLIETTTLIWVNGCMLGWWLGQQESSWFPYQLGPVFLCAPCAYVGSFQALWLPPTIQKHARQVNWWHLIDCRSSPATLNMLRWVWKLDMRKSHKAYIGSFNN